jgi:hypothetical protein
MTKWIAAALVAGTFVLPAQAAVMDIAITGLVGQCGGFDCGTVQDQNDAVWGGEAVRGAGFTATFAYDTSLGDLSSYPSGVPGETISVLTGGSVFLLPSIGAASVSIGSVTRSTDGSYASRVYIGSGLFWEENSSARYEASSGDTSTNYAAFSFDVNALAGQIGKGLTDEYTIDLPTNFGGPGDRFAFGFFYTYSGYDPVAVTYDEYSYVNLFASRVTATCRSGCGVDPAPIPLPASAFLLLAALGGAGALKLRRRRG